MKKILILLLVSSLSFGQNISQKTIDSLKNEIYFRDEVLFSIERYVNIVKRDRSKLKFLPVWVDRKLYYWRKREEFLKKYAEK